MIFNTFRKGVTPMSKKGIQNSSIEQIRNDHETETAFKVDDPKNMVLILKERNKFRLNPI